MLVKLKATNFKRFRDVEVELGQAVVLIGPNNSGKTTALQALALWQLGVRRWLEKRGGRAAPKKRPGVTINRRDLIAMPVPTANLLWRNLHLRSVERNDDGKLRTRNIRIDISVDGIDQGKSWSCGFEFDYANEESFYCRPLLKTDGTRMEVPEEAARTSIAFLPPMSGLIANETRLDPGAVQVRIGEGRTAEVLRNLCMRIYDSADGEWRILCDRIRSLFGVSLLPPKYIQERGEIVMSYEDIHGIGLDVSASGRGLQQTLLLLAYLQSNPQSVLLLDEPDAHLEILRQRQIYQLLTDVAREQNSQVVAASHSEVLLNEAADRDILVAFVGKPHRIDDRGSQISKALKLVGFEHYY
jgi:ABC-type taurine transport system ATPase subunit